MQKTCPECGEPFNRSHLPGCSFGPDIADREAYIKDHAVEMVLRLEDKVRKQAKVITRLENKVWVKSAEWEQMRSLVREAREYVEVAIGESPEFGRADEVLAKIDGVLGR